ncbi:DMT family transporter [Roseicyclus mahoneyensis]|uniref:S-adenosylmethionine uptake transporter n=1 Tax=Roseicyclus mahoneyensis TaxID=164332 RepID=A0A316GDS6_9RHOB|nr:DMT family transporter [Roseicyclus mahoneyensis]PWK59084.1 S-adenosylmethionine uptake transporter [Roseicyclus mahoneyensis]
MRAPLSPNLKGALYMTVSMGAFTLNDACVKLVAETVPLFQIVFLRGLVTTILLAVTVQMTMGLRLSIPRRDRPLVAWRTVAEVATMVAFLLALTNMPIANATAILSALPLFVTMGAALIFGDPVGWRRWTAIGVGFFGVMLIVQPGAEGFNGWSLLALLSVLMITGRDLLTRAFSPSVPSMTVAVLTAAAVCIFGGVASVFTPWTAMGAYEVALTLAASVFIIGGYVFGIMVMRIGEVGFVSPFRYTSLVFALILGFVIFNEFPNTLALCGVSIVITAGLYTLFRERARKASEASGLGKV